MSAEERQGYDLPPLTITIDHAPDEAKCGVCQAPAIEVYMFSHGGSALYRCAEHLTRMRSMLTGRGHALIDKAGPP